MSASFSTMDAADTVHLKASYWFPQAGLRGYKRDYMMEMMYCASCVTC